jgi:hypothetical protein
MTTSTTDVAFTSSVKGIQARKGSRASYAKLERSGGWGDRVTAELAEFLAERDSFYLATANADGRPYVQHRGGPRGFLRVLGERTLGFADFRGNRQYITLGNLADNPKAHLFLIDYATRQRVKIWGQARAIEDDPSLLDRLRPADAKAQVEQAIVLRIETWDVNCPQHIPQRFAAEDVAALLAGRDRRIAELEAQLARLTGAAPA